MQNSAVLQKITGIFDCEVKDVWLRRILFLSKLIPMLMVLFALAALAFVSSQKNGNIEAAMDGNTNLVITFLYCMLAPFFAYKIKAIENDICASTYKYACLNCIILVIANILIMNLLFLAMLLFIF